MIWVLKIYGNFCYKGVLIRLLLLIICFVLLKLCKKFWKIIIRGLSIG